MARTSPRARWGARQEGREAMSYASGYDAFGRINDAQSYYDYYAQRGSRCEAPAGRPEVLEFTGLEYYEVLELTPASTTPDARVRTCSY